MKKKTKVPAAERTPLEVEVVAQAKVLFEDEEKAIARCSICGGEPAPISSEELCWVCRRLKISAWRDSETQVAMQE